MVKWIIVAILLLPLAEIAVFGVVAAVVGFGWALLALVVTSLAGFLVLRRAGRDGVARFRAAVSEGGGAAFQSHRLEGHAGSLLTVLGGVLLFLPGFLTGIVGGALLIPPLRTALGGLFGRAVQRTARRRRPGEPSTIDLEPDQWRPVPDRELPKNEPRRD
jgi:UPF0716 protein FxsA